MALKLKLEGLKVPEVRRATPCQAHISLFEILMTITGLGASDFRGSRDLTDTTRWEAVSTRAYYGHIFALILSSYLAFSGVL